MTDTAIVGRHVDVLQTGLAKGNSPISWSAAIAGAIAAIAVSFLVISLGSGIGLSLASPFRSSPSGTTLTVAGAVWLIMAMTFGFACGGYLAARLRAHFNDDVLDETRFRDAAQGFLVWAIGVVTMFAIGALTAMFATGAASVASAGKDTSTQQTSSVADPTAYYVDMLFRPTPGGPPATAGAPPSSTVGIAGAGAAPAQAMEEARAEASRILVRAIKDGRIADDDRAYLVQLVSARTGLNPDEAQRRVTTVEEKARQDAREAADKAAKAGSYVSFWTFMALLFGAVAAVLGGMVGGELRDALPERTARAMAGS